jgi:hypothetical protein
MMKKIRGRVLSLDDGWGTANEEDLRSSVQP